MNIYTENGYKDRADYLHALADDMCADFATVCLMADLLGESEDFDGLVSMLEDAAEGM